MINLTSDIIAQVEQTLDDLGARLPLRRQVLILTHDYPDPDALASAAAVQLLLKEHWSLPGKIIFNGVVTRAENRELLRHFKPKWTFLNQWRGARRETPAIIVDAVPWSGNVTLPAFAHPIAVFDHHHHGKRKNSGSMLTDITPELGALATRMVECLVVTGIPIPKWLASILAYAITTETFDFIRQSSPRDLNAYIHLLSNCNLKMLGQIKNAVLPREYYTYLGEAMRNAFTYGRVSWTHLSAISQPEIVAEIADMLLRMERITWAFCTAFVDNRLLISLRSRLANSSCAKVLRTIVEKQGGSAGGHGQTAGGYINLPNISLENREQLRVALISSLVQHIEGFGIDNAKPLVEIPPAPDQLAETAFLPGFNSQEKQ